MRRRFDPLVTFNVPETGGGQVVPVAGPEIYVDTVKGAAGRSGQSWEKAISTMDEAFDKLAEYELDTGVNVNHAAIYVIGTVAEQLTAPLGVQGVKIIGCAGGRTRHDDGVRWKEEATATNAPLLTLREQGWELRNILMVPETGYSAVKLHRAESATYPDASHAIFGGCKFIGNVAIGSAGGIGIEDYGGMHHVLVEDCEFANLVSAIVATNASIAAPLRNVIRRNTFELNTHDIRLNASHCVIQANLFKTVWNTTTHPNIINLQYTADAATGNHVIDNYFSDAAAAVLISKGYKASTGDVWRNFTATEAAALAGVPGA